MSNSLVDGFDEEVFHVLLNGKFGGSFSASRASIPLKKDYGWERAERLGIVKTLAGPGGANMPLLVVAAKLHDGDTLKERSSRIRQFKFAKQTLDQAMADPPSGVEGVLTQGLFVFYDDHGNFRLSLVYGRAEGAKLVWSTAKRLSFYVEAGHPNKTFRDRMALDWSTFDKLKDAFSVEKLTKEFYNRLFDWYQWALSDEMNVTYPNQTDTDDDDREINEHIIRLITRLMFVWFLKQKHLVPDNLFDPAKLKGILKNFDPLKGDNYYRAILQNLFFATLNSEISERAFAVQTGDRREHFDIKTLYRYGPEFALPEKQVLKLFEKIPFLNGGLFECLDRGKNYSDGFSRNSNKQARLPNRLFFDEAQGLIPLLSQYNFTVEENSPGDEEVALDPELLGKVFENLLGAYNPETEEPARKATGSFYTPREIVNYMVDESLIAHLKNVLTTKYAKDTKKEVEHKGTKEDEIENKLRKLFAGNEGNPFCKEETAALDRALVTAKILDPACGSGAFPMGILLRMVNLLRILRGIPEDHSVYDLKLELIENCIYGGDIQCIAVQISKLRFFISLVCEQKPTSEARKNYGINPLPNLETKFVAADSLIGLPRSGDALPMQNVEKLKRELWSVRHRHFLARSYKEKKELRKEDKKLRTELAKALEEGGGFDTDSARLMAEWDPYDQNTSAPFSDPEWMFNVRDGFDVVIGNPPYIDSEKMSLLLPDKREMYRKIFQLTGNWDIYMAFFGYADLASKGVVCFITPDKWLSKPFGDYFRRDIVSQKLAILIHCGSGIFENVTVDALITLLCNRSVRALFCKYNSSQDVEVLHKCDLKSIKEPYIFDHFFSANLDLLSKIESGKPHLSKFWSCENACATSDAYKLVPLIKEGDVNSSSRTHYRLINTGTLSKFFPLWGTQPITYLKKELGFKPLYPIVSKQDFADSLGKTYQRRAASKKIISKGLNLLDVCLDLDGQYIPGKSTLVICDDSDERLKTLSAILNSKLALFYFKSKYSSSSYCGGISFTPDMVNSLPVLSGDADKILVSLVDKVINKGNLTSCDMEQINQRVYSLYKLSPSEIMALEKSVSKSPAGDRIQGTDKREDVKAADVEPKKKRGRKAKAALPASLPGWD